MAGYPLVSVMIMAISELIYAGYTLIEYDGNKAILTSHEDCVLVFADGSILRGIKL